MRLTARAGPKRAAAGNKGKNVMKARILIVDDEPKQVGAFAQVLEREGYEVVIAEDDAEALYLLDEFRPDLIILDIGFGYETRRGLDLLKRIRAGGETMPIIMLTGLIELVKELELSSFALNADDFVDKLKDPEVLLSRVKARLRRILQEPIEIDHYLMIDLIAGRVWVKRDGEWQEVHLEPKELELLRVLVTRPGQVIPRERLWNFFPDAEDLDATLNRYISELRKKLEPDPCHPRYILTKRGSATGS